MKFKTAVLLYVTVFGTLPLVAQQRGQYMPGQSGLNAGILPSPGFTYGNIEVNYSSSTLNGPKGNRIPIDGTYNVWAIENIFYYVPSVKVLGGNLGFMVILPTLANGSLAVPEYGVNGGGFGLADTWLQPISLGWHLKRADFQVADAFMLPTGRYTVGASDNIGYGYFGNHVTTGSTVYITKNKATSANIMTDWEAHGNKSGTNGAAGQAFTDEWGFGQLLPLKKDFSQLLQVGAVGYDQWQITNSTGSLANTPYYSSHAAGLQTTYILPKKQVNLFFKYYWQYSAYSTSLGNSIVFGGSWTLLRPKPNP
jgi:hypothetical protein